LQHVSCLKKNHTQNTTWSFIVGNVIKREDWKLSCVLKSCPNYRLIAIQKGSNTQIKIYTIIIDIAALRKKMLYLPCNYIGDTSVLFLGDEMLMEEIPVDKYWHA